MVIYLMVIKCQMPLSNLLKNQFSLSLHFILELKNNKEFSNSGPILFFIFVLASAIREILSVSTMECGKSQDQLCQRAKVPKFHLKNSVNWKDIADIFHSILGKDFSSFEISPLSSLTFLGVLGPVFFSLCIADIPQLLAWLE